MAKPNYKKPAFLSLLFPGIGQVLKKQYSKAFLIWLILGLLTFSLHQTIVIPVVFWIWNVYDALKSVD